jgi:hypothetical protein
MKLFLSAAVLLLAIAACHQVTDYTPQPRMTQGPTKSANFVVVHWVGDDIDEVVRACPELKGGTYYGCARDNGVCDVWVQQPKDFNDVARLAVLGHEILHCLGARHE